MDVEELTQDLEDVEDLTQVGKRGKNSVSTTGKTHQQSLNTFLSIPDGSVKQSSADLLNLDSLADKVANKVVEKLKGSGCREVKTGGNDVPRRMVKATNLLEFIEEVPEFAVLGEENSYVLRCTSCHTLLSNFLAVAVPRKPTGSTSGSLATGLHLPNEVYDQLVAGHCEKWYHQKEELVNHLSMETHLQALQYAKYINKNLKEVNVVRNQLRTALQYESRIAELHAAGANVGDFGHSRKLFPEMLAVACAYIDKKSTEFLSTPLSNTGMPPHFYVTADKSTNHRITNQVSMLCPVVDGKRQGIPLSLRVVK